MLVWLRHFMEILRHRRKVLIVPLRAFHDFLELAPVIVPHERRVELSLALELAEAARRMPEELQLILRCQPTHRVTRTCEATHDILREIFLQNPMRTKPVVNPVIFL